MRTIAQILKLRPGDVLDREVSVLIGQRAQWSRSENRALELIEKLRKEGWMVIVKYQAMGKHFLIGGCQGGEYDASEDPARRPKPDGVAVELQWCGGAPYRVTEWAICDYLPEAVAKAYAQMVHSKMQAAALCPSKEGPHA
jgi:hypothetical protein